MRLILEKLKFEREPGSFHRWSKDRTPEQAWKECTRGDWLVEFVIRLGIDHKIIVYALCQNVRSGLCYVPQEDKRPLEAVAATEEWVRDEAGDLPVLEASFRAKTALREMGTNFHKKVMRNCKQRRAMLTAYAAFSVAYYAVMMKNRINKAESTRDMWKIMEKMVYATSASHELNRAKQNCDILREHIPWATVEKAIQAVMDGQ